MRHSHILPLLALSVSCALPYRALAEDPRQVLNFDKEWKFHVGNAEGADAAAFDDKSWDAISVPHDYAITGHGGTPKDPSKMEGPFDPNSPAGDGGGYLDAGPAWYRKTFTLPPSAKDHRVAIQFNGVYMDSTIYLNGKQIQHAPLRLPPSRSILRPTSISMAPTPSPSTPTSSNPALAGTPAPEFIATFI